jgi:hypothetical protein
MANHRGDYQEGHNGNQVVVKHDTGYLQICPRCNARAEPSPELIGKPRCVTIEICASCDGKPRKGKAVRYEQ